MTPKEAARLKILDPACGSCPDPAPGPSPDEEHVGRGEMRKLCIISSFPLTN